MANQTAKSLKSKALGDLDTGKLPQALKKAQLGVKKFPSDSDFPAIAGFVLTEMKQYRKSIPFFIEASRMKPDDPQFVENLANALLQTSQISRALTFAEQKLDQFPNNKELVRVIDEITVKGTHWREIIESTNKRLKTDPENANLLATRGRALGKIGYMDEATRDIQKAYALSPDTDSIALKMAVNLHQSGDKTGCATILRKILAKTPDNAIVLLQLSSLVEIDEIDDLAAKVDQAIAERDQPLSDLEFAKAQLISRRDGLEAALPQFARANAVQHEPNPHNAVSEEKKYSRICNIFTEDSAFSAPDENLGPRPIFVIGQPRSGTTLMEMMLSAAPDIAGCGELTLMGELTLDYVEDGKTYNAKAATELARDFRNLMPPLPEGTAAFVDKMPHNYQYVGFILTAFPDARVINMLRDPRDVGLSKWIRPFPAAGMRYASNLASIAHSANLYRRYMAHWDKVFGDRILTIPYEELVADPEPYSRKVAQFCGLEWNAQMMHPEKNTKQVRTASIDQVRQKISTKSIGGWRGVADHIQPMLDGFDPALWPEYDFG